MVKKVASLSIAILLLVVASVGSVFHPPVASAANGSDWRAGRIIDDVVFTDKSSMSVADIQNFLNQKVGTGGYDSVPGQCDTNGSRNAAPYNSGVSRATYATSIGRPTRFTCLNNYYEVPKTSPGPGIPASNYGSDTIPSGAKSAAQLIWDAAQAYNISPKVLLVTIQKESPGPLTTDDWPWQTQYTYAMGAHCPDTSGCDSNYAGFSIQIAESAALYRYYLDNMNQPWWPYKHLGNNVVQYNPNTSCGSSNVDIETMATAALYTYTPYQPNQAALNNLYGTGDSCSAYGNRNFWRIYSDWFGSLWGCDYPRGISSDPTNIYGNGGTAAIPGNWTSTTGQGFAYATPNYSGGFDVAVMTPSSNGLVWQGNWWSQTNGSIGLSNTILIPAKNSDGLTDLYYATSTNWSRPGFTVGLMHNNGHGFTYAGTQWVTTSLSLSNITFIPGNWTAGGGGQGFAYATPNYSGGFDVAVMTPSSNGLVWQGVKWNQTNGSISRMNTVFAPADTDNDGLTDLYYATSINWSVPGFSVGLMHNNGTNMTWGGPQWSNSTLNLGTTIFLPGSWTGSSNGQGFAYVTSCGTRGFDVSVMIPSSNGLQWRGQWWQAPSLPLTSTVFIPADQDGDGYTDLYYATRNGDYGFSIALQHNNGGGSYGWQGVQWSPNSIPLRSTMFLPSR